MEKKFNIASRTKTKEGYIIKVQDVNGDVYSVYHSEGVYSVVGLNNHTRENYNDSSTTLDILYSSHSTAVFMHLLPHGKLLFKQIEDYLRSAEEYMEKFMI